MNSIAMSLVVFGCAFGGALFGLFLRTKLPGHHLNTDAKEAVKLIAGLVATLTALVLGLLISSAKSSYDATDAMVTQSGAKILVMDRILNHYGPEASDIRQLLQNLVKARIAQVWPEELHKLPEGNLTPQKLDVETLQKALRQLAPQTDRQRALLAKALQVSDEMAEIRWLIFEQLQTSLPTIFLSVLIFWATILFICFGLLAPNNGTLLTIFLISAIAIASAIFLIMEMEKPLEGAIKLSGTPMIKTYLNLGK